MEDEHDVKEGDNIADSNGEIERDCTSLLDQEDHHERRVGVGNNKFQEDIPKKLGRNSKKN